MAARQRVWARRARAALVQSLGGVCATCGVSHPLECDCVEPRGDWHHRIGFAQRVSFYRREAASGNLQLLCPLCHVVKTRRDAELPF